MEGIYLYGIVGFPPPLSRQILGHGGSPIVLIQHADLAAVASRSSLSLWPVDEAHLTLHEVVVEEVMEARAILPVRFNTLLKTQEAVVGFLDERAQALRLALQRVDGKVEMGLRVLWEAPGLAESSGDQEVGGGGPGTAYLGRRLKEEQHQARLRTAGGQVIGQVQALLHPRAVESWLQRCPTDRLLFTGAYLVGRDRADAFREAVTHAREKFPRLRFLLTGPWPPYHFVSGAHDGTKDALSA